jgi:predicted membrane-bound dolichyl-phosphate-mannose-protein mannosyltransferase
MIYLGKSCCAYYFVLFVLFAFVLTRKLITILNVTLAVSSKISAGLIFFLISLVNFNKFS